MEMMQQKRIFFKRIQDAWVWINKQDNQLFDMKEGDSIVISGIRGLKGNLTGTLIEANWNTSDGWDIVLVHDKGKAHWKQKHDGGIIKEVIRIEVI